MNAPSPIDPLEAVDLLVEEISGAQDVAGDLSKLVRAIDMLIYSLHFIDPGIPDVAQTELEPPRLDYRQAYEATKHRYPALGLYWSALHPVIEEGTEGEVAVDDAIDDLADILLELSDVQWLKQHASREGALSALRVRYDTHLWMHFHSLRQYLEEVKRYD